MTKKTSSPKARAKQKASGKPALRILPLTMMIASGLLVLKSMEVYQSGKSFRDELLISNVIAQDEKPEPKAEPAAPAAEQPAEEAAEHDGGEHGGSKKKEAPVPQDPYASKPSASDMREASVLESLSQRRKRLDQFEEELNLKEKVLQATEKRIEGKITELNTLSAELKELLVAYDTEENAKIQSLVKIYEAMKPKDAARIFDEMDMDVLLMVVDRMSERRVAPVLAAMNPEKAKNVTQELADQQKRRPKVDPDTFNSPPL